MSIPVRCYSCNYVIGKFEMKIEEMLKRGMNYGEIFESLGVEKYCCRTNIMATVDVSSILLRYKPLPREEK